MAIERVTERADGTRERVIEREGGTTYVDAGGGGGLGAVVIGVAVLALVAIIAFFLIQSNHNDALRTTAVTSATSSVADSVSTAADNVGAAANRAADAVAPSK